jgi:AcrR family transcriptional regulator
MRREQCPAPNFEFRISIPNMKVSVRKRPYRMVARARATAATGERILDAAVEVFFEDPGASISLDEVARRAGVTVQTVIRRFGGRDGLLAAAAARETNRVRREREVAPGDVAGAVRALVSHYENTGDRVLVMLAQEAGSPMLRETAELGRKMHREWCESVFASALSGLTVTQRARRLAQLVAVCDVYTWMLLRRQAGLGRHQTELAIRELLKPLTEGKV